ncbi:hypothetical protein D9615_009149 [Tricholomella constricta]|uniref:Uncharacterized protein n=1 Tax=Tricholomella constricta TaxID=117010 RepID=A0A8H5H2L1_9AGAR|nr:hypothetical protein D9615_009149 [Tricholomella constricta]
MISTIVTHSAPPCSPIMTITLTSTDPKAELISSLSGNLADYRFVASAPGQIFITAIDSHRERFRKTKAKLKEVVEEKRMLEEDREALRRSHIYKKILAELHEVWWPRLPNHVHRAFILAGRTDLPSTIVSWWLQWQEFSPSEFPLPPSLRHFGPVKLHTRGRFIFNHETGKESELSKAVSEAWDILPDTIRQLMLLTWAGVQSVRSMHNDVAHPDLGNSTAKDILDRDFHNTFESLHAIACNIADYLFDG